MEYVYLIILKGGTTIKSNRYRFIYDSYDNHIMYTTTM